jgi:putative ABC transport system permease protein
MGIELKLRAGADLPAEAPEDGGDAVLLGLGLARALDARDGDVVTILALTPSGNLNAVDMKVLGLFTTGLQEIDGRMLKLHLVSAQRLLETTSASSIFVAIGATEQTASIRDLLERKLALAGPPVAVLDWQTRAPFYGQVRALYSAIFVFLGTIIFVLVSLAASNSLLMSVMERIREIGTLLALGTSRAQVALLILCEALWLGILGGLVGIALGVGIAAALRVARVEMPPPPGAVDPMLLDLLVLPGDVLAIAVLMVVVLLVAATVPVLKAIRLRIVEALAHV